MFVKAGSILFTQKPVQHALEDAGEVEVWIYPGANAECTYYNDDGISYDYEKGQYEQLQLEWDDASKKLTISEKSRFRTKPIILNVQCGGIIKTVSYDGGCITVTMN